MSEAEKQQQRIREFMNLLPLTVELAGMPKSEAGRYYNPEQIETRGITIRNAYKVARQLVTDLSK